MGNGNGDRNLQQIGYDLCSRMLERSIAVQPGAIKLLIRELQHFKWDVIGIAEIHLTEVDNT